MAHTEELREALLDLEEARKKEIQQRQISEVLLAGLQVLVESAGSGDIFHKIFDVLRQPLDFRAACVLAPGTEGLLVPIAFSDPRFANTTWKPAAAFRRAMTGNPVATFDTTAVEEWRLQNEILLEGNRSALVFSMGTAARPALFLCTHPERAHFSRHHINLAARFSLLAAQAMMRLDAEQRVNRLEEKLATEARLAELHRKLADQEKKLVRAQKLEGLGRLAGSVAHDLNNILSGIVSYPDLLLMSPDLTPKQRRIVETIRDAGLRAAAVVQDLLTVTRGVAVTREAVPLNELLRQFLAGPEYRAMMADRQGVSVSVDSEAQPLFIQASRAHVEKALTNLFANALEAVQGRTDGVVTLKAEKRHLDQPLGGYENIVAGEYAVLTVADNGPGITADDMERIFEPFYAKKKLGRSGTGLGLTIVWNIVHDHNGYIDLQTGAAGTQFSLYFPIAPDTGADKPTDIADADYRGHGERILVVDDQEDQRRIACNMLTNLGYEAVAVAGGEEAVAYLRDKPADLLVLDMVMNPGMNGRETYERIIRFRPHQKAIIASGYSLDSDVQAAQALGAGAFLKKPYRLEELGRAIKKELSRI